jgi:hypothetical protein
MGLAKNRPITTKVIANCRSRTNTVAVETRMQAPIASTTTPTTTSGSITTVTSMVSPCTSATTISPTTVTATSMPLPSTCDIGMIARGKLAWLMVE